MDTPEDSGLQIRIDAFRQIGAERAAQLSRIGVVTLNDLFLHRPRRYEDRRRWLPIQSLELDSPATVKGKVVAMGVKRFRKGSKSVFELILDDGTARLHCRWWNLPFMQNYFRVGEEVFAYGKALSLRPRTMDHPETEALDDSIDNYLHVNRIVPIYPLTEGLYQRWLRSFIWQKLAEFGDRIPEAKHPSPPDSFFSRPKAIRELHFPDSAESAERARARLALDELIDLQQQLRHRRLNLESKSKALPCAGDNRWIKPFLHQLGFTLTPGQTEVLKQIRRDLGGKAPMRRLLQGDVGCGKTVVAACAALMTLESGFDVALMAPTEILAEQHYRNFQTWLSNTPIQLAMQTGSRKSGTEPLLSTSAATPVLCVGTHALIQQPFEMKNLGLVIIDEQHKFGVTQREALLRKGHYPHLLVMTATPIPRTLGLTLYGDLDLSVIQHPPSGRGTIKTFVRSADRLPKVWDFVKTKLQNGSQAYVVYPRVEDAGNSGLKAVKEQFGKLTARFAPFRVGLLHGRLPAEAKNRVITEFRQGLLHLLVATSVIEVGIDVPNASVMVIEDAGQFGLAQLHQLRGRIGRGPQESFCILVAEAKSQEAKDRLKILEDTRDGFRIAEADLQLRGPGELLGHDQSGIPDFRFAHLGRDLRLIELARKLAWNETTSR